MIEFFIIGNLGADAVMNKDGNLTFLNFHVCHSDVVRNRPENRESKKYWVDCAYLCDSEELLKMMTKGTQVYAKGTPETKIHIKPDTREPIAVQYLRVSKLEVLSKRRKEETT